MLPVRHDYYEALNFALHRLYRNITTMQTENHPCTNYTRTVKTRFITFHYCMPLGSVNITTQLTPKTHHN